MLDKYLLLCEDLPEPLGILSVDIENDFFDFESNPKYIGDLPAFLAFPNAPMPMKEKIKRWVLGRAPDTNYVMIETLIKKAGLKEYDAYGFFKYNNGEFITDRFYVEPI